MRIFHNPNFNFVKWRWHALILSSVVIGAGMFTIARGGLPLGVDFSGGTEIVLRFDRPVTEDAVRKALPVADAVVQTIGAPADHKIMIRLPMMKGADAANIDAQADEVPVRERVLGIERREGDDAHRAAGAVDARVVQRVDVVEVREVADGETGLIRVFDLANVFSVLAIQTEDLGVRRGDGFDLLGRTELAEQRGCSLMAT